MRSSEEIRTSSRISARAKLKPGAVLNTYLRALRRAQGVGVPELSLYGHLQRLLNAVGAASTPAVTAILHPKSAGAGIPDGGLFLTKQLSRAGGSSSAFKSQPPTHGVIEAKPIEDDLLKIAHSTQVRKYVDRFGKVLLTNFWQFLLVSRDAHDNVITSDSFELASDVAEFDTLLFGKRRPGPGLAQALVDYLSRILTRDAPITRPEELAYHFASYARQALGRLESSDLSALDPLRKAFDHSLGVTFEGEEGQRFFRSTLIQALFYGAFSAWVLWSAGSEAARGDRFEWKSAAWFTNVPVVGALFEHVAKASTLRPLRIDEVLDWAGDALNRVNRDEFFGRFSSDDAVQYFYEPFLAEFDPILRRQLGVWYTPPEVVRYMVSRVDQVLRNQFNLAEGLADDNVYVLDPCTGTGSFLLEVLRIVQLRKSQAFGDQLVGIDVKHAALTRVFGFEILPAPFVIAHLQLGLFLDRIGAPLNDDRSERVGVYLTNALTGWTEEESAPKSLFPNFAHDRNEFPELARERDAARDVKRTSPILVILGNPPYNGFAGVSPAEEGGLVEPYKEGLKAWGLGSKNYINDLYVRFLRVAERRITEMTGQGIVCLISNFGYLSDPTLVVLRQRLLAEFDHIWIDNLHGDTRETGKTPWGTPDPSIFKQRGSPGIRIGTAIATLARLPGRQLDHKILPAGPEEASMPRGHGLFRSVQYRDFWGATKRQNLLDSLDDGDHVYKSWAAVPDTAYSFRPQQLHPNYFHWPRVMDLAEEAPMLGLNENRHGALIDADRNALVERMQRYFDPSAALARLDDDLRGIRGKAARFDPAHARIKLLLGGFVESKVLRYLVRPFERQWAYVETEARLWNEARPRLVRAASHAERFLLVRRRTPRANDGAAFAFADCLGDQHALNKDAYYLPFRLNSNLASASTKSEDQSSLFSDGAATTRRRGNFSPRARRWLIDLGLTDPDNDTVSEQPWLHALAIGFTPSYLAENRDAGRFTYHRVPIPGNSELLAISAQLGEQITALLDTDRAVPGVTKPEGPDAVFWNGIASIGSKDGGPLGQEDLRLQGWATLQADVVLPSRGSSNTRLLTDMELAARARLYRGSAVAETALGARAVDVRLNSRVRWVNVPETAWNYSVGGYPVLRKWLSYRDARILGRGLTVHEVREFSGIVRRITALLLLGPSLDTSYRACVEFSHHW